MIKKAFIPYYDQDIELEGYAAYPVEAKRPLVILCHAWRGRDDFICEKTDWIAGLGYVGFAIDIYGKGVIGKSNAENAILKKPFVEDRLSLLRRLLM
jgi:dienelactone hydrolase